MLLMPTMERDKSQNYEASLRLWDTAPTINACIYEQPSVMVRGDFEEFGIIRTCGATHKA